MEWELKERAEVSPSSTGERVGGGGGGGGGHFIAEKAAQHGG